MAEVLTRKQVCHQIIAGNYCVPFLVSISKASTDRVSEEERECTFKGVSSMQPDYSSLITGQCDGHVLHRLKQLRSKLPIQVFGSSHGHSSYLSIVYTVFHSQPRPTCTFAPNPNLLATVPSTTLSSLLPFHHHPSPT